MISLALAFIVVGSAGAVAQARPNNIPVLIEFDHQPGPSDQALVRGHGGQVNHTYRFVPGIAATLPEAAMHALSNNPNVKSVVRDIGVSIHDEVTPWGVDRIDAETIHVGDGVSEGVKGTGVTGSGVIVGILDTGIDLDHPDLAPNIVDSITFAGGKNADDKNGHGSHTAGTVAAVGNNNIGVIGVAPDASLYAIKVLGNSGSGNWANVIAGVEHAMDPDGDGYTGDHLGVTSNSYGSSGNPGSLVRAAFDAAAEIGVIHVASAGNSSGGAVGYPAKYASVIAVSATTDGNDLAGYSSVGPEVDFAAPGSGVLSTYKGGSYATLNGTSMSSPHVAGVVALALSGGVDPADVRALLEGTAEYIPGLTAVEQGHGLIDAENALFGTTDGDDYVAGEVVDPPPAPDPGPTGSDMGVYDVTWKAGRHLTIVVNIREDSDGNDVLDESLDSPVDGASVRATLTYDKDGDGNFECDGDDTCWKNFGGTTNSSGDRQLKLDAYHEVPEALQLLSGRTLIILSNGAPSMLQAAVKSAGVGDALSHVISADQVRSYKPDPNVYRLATSALGMDAASMAFVSSNSFDVMGAKSFGFWTCWVNRQSAQPDELGITPDIEVNSLTELAEALGK